MMDPCSIYLLSLVVAAMLETLQKKTGSNLHSCPEGSAITKIWHNTVRLYCQIPAVYHAGIKTQSISVGSLVILLYFRQELAEFMGLQKLNDRIRDATLQAAFEGLFPRDDPANTRYTIYFK